MGALSIYIYIYIWTAYGRHMDISHIYNKITHHHLYNSTVGDRQTRVAKVSKGLAQNRSCLGSD